MALSPRDHRHQYLRFEGLQYTDADILDFESRLTRIYKREDADRATGMLQGMSVFTILACSCNLISGGQCFSYGVEGHRETDPRQGESEGLLDRDLISWRFLWYLRLFAAGRKSGAHISGGQFIARLAEHFGLLTAEILQGLTVIALELLIIDMAELVKLHIYVDIDDTWAWVAMGPERQPDAAVGVPRVAQDAPAIDEGVQADLEPIQAPPPPPAAARTMPQRMAN
ncbi:hypothetical protein Tco_0537081 [Tanacetum coccineum]